MKKIQENIENGYNPSENYKIKTLSDILIVKSRFNEIVTNNTVKIVKLKPISCIKSDVFLLLSNNQVKTKKNYFFSFKNSFDVKNFINFETSFKTNTWYYYSLNPEGILVKSAITHKTKSNSYEDIEYKKYLLSLKRGTIVRFISENNEYLYGVLLRKHIDLETLTIAIKHDKNTYIKYIFSAYSGKCFSSLTSETLRNYKIDKSFFI